MCWVVYLARDTQTEKRREASFVKALTRNQVWWHPKYFFDTASHLQYPLEALHGKAAAQEFSCLALHHHALYVPFGLTPLLQTQLRARLGPTVRRFVQTGCYIMGASRMH